MKKINVKYFMRFFRIIYNQIVWPSKKEWFFLVTIIFLYAFGTTFVINGDGTYGYAMVEKLSDPGAFASNDIVVNGSLQGNFLFYKLLVFLPFFQNNFVLWDLVISSVFSIILLLGWYNIFLKLTRSKMTSWMGIFFLLFVDSRLSLGGTLIPLFYLTSISSVQFLQTIGLLLFLNKKYTVSFVLICLSSYFHPASAFFYLAVLVPVLFLEIWKDKRFKYFTGVLVVIAAVLLPNIILVGRNLELPADTQKFFDIFYNLNGHGVGHAYIESYFTLSYTYTIAVLTLLFLIFRKNKQVINEQKTVANILIFSCVAVILWLINLYFIRNLPVFYLYFAMRSTYILKPLLIILLSVLIITFVREKSSFSKVAAVLLVVSLIEPFISLAVLFVLPVIAWMALRDRVVSLDEKLLISSRKIIGKFGLDNRRTLILLVVVFLVISVGLFGYKFNNKWHKLYRLMRGENLFNYSFSEKRNFGYITAYPEISKVIDWAKSFKGKMIITPPENCLFGNIRFITRNSLYVNICEMGQLSYMPKYYYVGYERLQEIGFRVISRGVFDSSDYNKLDLNELRMKNEADYIIFDKYSTNYFARREKPVFEDKQYIIYSLR